MTRPLDVRFVVHGIPVPKGNHAAFPIARGRCEQCKPGARCRRRNCFGGTIVGTVVTDDGGGELEAWQQLIKVSAISARNVAGVRLVERPGALELRLIFMLQRPAGHWTGRGELSADGMRHPVPTVKPDWDKVSRAAADGVVGALCEDDAQIAIAAVAKIYAPDNRPGVVIGAREVHATHAWIIDDLNAAGIRSAACVQGELI